MDTVWYGLHPLSGAMDGGEFSNGHSTGVSAARDHGSTYSLASRDATWTTNPFADSITIKQSRRILWRAVRIPCLNNWTVCNLATNHRLYTIFFTFVPARACLRYMNGRTICVVRCVSMDGDYSEVVLNSPSGQVVSVIQPCFQK